MLARPLGMPERLHVRKGPWRHQEYAYGKTAWDYRDTLRAQGGGCAICKRPPRRGDDKIERFIWDHDHACCDRQKTCGKCVRELLCSRCNLIVGLIECGGAVTEALAYVAKWGNGAK